MKWLHRGKNNRFAGFKIAIIMAWDAFLTLKSKFLQRGAFYFTDVVDIWSDTVHSLKGAWDQS